MTPAVHPLVQAKAAECAITFAVPAGRGETLAKIIRVENGRIVAKAPSPQIKLHRFHEQKIRNLADLKAALMAGASLGAIAVRGKPIAQLGRRAHHDDPVKGPAGLEVVARCWCAFDFDALALYLGLPPEAADDPKQWPDPLRQPEIGAEIAVQALPPQFHNASYVWQVTGGAGYEPGMWRLRLWFWFDRPATGTEVKLWVKPSKEAGWLDDCTLVESQPIYLGVKVVGGPDPCPARFGLITKENDAVPVPDIAALEARQEALRKARRGTAADPEVPPMAPGPLGVWAGSAGDWRLGEHPTVEAAVTDCIAEVRRNPAIFDEQMRKAGSFAAMADLPWPPILAELKVASAEARIDAAFEAVQRATAGARHPTYKVAVQTCDGLCRHHGIAWEPVRDALISAYESTLSAHERQQRERGSIIGMMDWVERR